MALGMSGFSSFRIIKLTDTLGLHRVENPSHSDSAVSLHLYCPPFNSCSIFNKTTGKRTSANVTFWSKFGEKRDKVQRRQKFLIFLIFIGIFYNHRLSQQPHYQKITRAVAL